MNCPYCNAPQQGVAGEQIYFDCNTIRIWTKDKLVKQTRHCLDRARYQAEIKTLTQRLEQLNQPS